MSCMLPTQKRGILGRTKPLGKCEPVFEEASSWRRQDGIRQISGYPERSGRLFGVRQLWPARHTTEEQLGALDSNK